MWLVLVTKLNDNLNFTVVLIVDRLIFLQDYEIYQLLFTSKQGYN